MDILFTNYCISHGSGTEMFLYDLCEELVRLGHRCAVYTHRYGPLVDKFRSAHIEVINDFFALPWRPDVLHCHHSMETLEAISHFKTVPALYLCHDATVWFDQCPPPLCVERYLAVDTFVQSRVVVDTGLQADQIGLAFNAINERRFTSQRKHSLQKRPSKALLFHSNLLSSAYKDIARAACADLNIHLSEAGHGGLRVIQSPEIELPKYDVVFAKGRCALEALACGCAVVLAGGEGFGPLVTVENFHSLRMANFGRSLLSDQRGVEWVIDKIGRFNQENVESVSALTREHSSLARLAQFMLAEYMHLGELTPPPSQQMRTAIAHTLHVKRFTDAQNPSCAPKSEAAHGLRKVATRLKSYFRP